MRTSWLNKDESIIMESQGSLYLRNSWNQGHVYLTNRRLLFFLANKLLFQIGLNGIVGFNIEKNPWLLGVRIKQLCISYGKARSKDRVCLAVVNPENWADVIKHSMTLMLAERCENNGTDTEPTSNA